MGVYSVVKWALLEFSEGVITVYLQSTTHFCVILTQTSDGDRRQCWNVMKTSDSGFSWAWIIFIRSFCLARVYIQLYFIWLLHTLLKSVSECHKRNLDSAKHLKDLSVSQKLLCSGNISLDWLNGSLGNQQWIFFSGFCFCYWTVDDVSVPYLLLFFTLLTILISLFYIHFILTYNYNV